MPELYESLPDEDESVDVLAAEFDDTLRALLPGWEPSDGALEVALRAAFADEVSTLYALLRDQANDEYHDFGQSILGIIPGGATPAVATTTWEARDTDGPYLIEAGQTLVIDAAEGRYAFEVVTDVTIPNGETTATDVEIQALDDGTETNGLTGDVLFDEQPAWVESVTLDTVTAGGTDPEDPAEFLNRVRRAAQLLSRAPILPRDFELVAQEVSGVARALVLDGYDHDTDLEDQERTVSIYPVDADGLAVSSGVKAEIQARVEARREVNWIVRVADPTYTTVNVDITVTAEEDADPDEIEAAVAAAIEGGPLNPAVHGDIVQGEQPTWRLRTLIRRYEIAATADRVDGVYDVAVVEMSDGADPVGDQDVTLDGPAPLPLAGDVTVTVVTPPT